MKKIVTGVNAKNNAKWMDIATIIASVIVPLVIFLFGAAILIYALTRYHPNPKVGRYIQASTYRFYGTIGAVIPIGTFIPLNNAQGLWLGLWAVSAVILILSSIYALFKIQKDEWCDIEYEAKV